MAYNLIVAYDLIAPGQNYDAVRAKIKSLGSWYQLQYSLFYLNTGMTPDAVHTAVRSAMDPNDKLTVVNALSAQISPISNDDIAAINATWLRKAA